MKKLLFILFVCCLWQIANAQQTVKGKITDTGGNPLSEVSISVKNTDSKTFTDVNGNYSIVIPLGFRTLSFQKTGYSVQEIEINSSEINLILTKEESNLIDLSLEELMNMEVVSVSKKAESVLTAPQTVIILTDDEIRKRGYTDIEQILHDLPGFDFSRGAGCEYSQIYQRGYRSKNPDRTMLMVDGVEQNDLWSNSAWFARQYPLSNIKRVEVVYGPASTVYGANAFLGVVNIITKDESDIIKENKNFGFSSNVGFGTWNTRYFDITLAGKYNDVALTLTTRVYHTDNMDLSKYPDWDFDISKYDINYYMKKLGTNNAVDAQKAMDLDKKGYKVYDQDHKYENKANDFFINANLKIKDLTIDIQHWRRANQYGAWYRDDWEFGSWVPSHTYIYTKYEKKVSNSFTLSNYNSYKFNRLEGTPNKDYYYLGYLNGYMGLTDLANNEMPYWYESFYATYSQQFRSELKANINVTEKFNITSGIEFRQNIIQGNYITSTKPDPEETGFDPKLEGGNHFYSTDLGVYAQTNYKASDLFSFVLGARMDYNKIRVNGGYGTVFCPKAAVVITPKNMIFKLIYSEAFKDADFFTKYSTTAKRIANPTLEPERVKNFELNAGWQITSDLFFDITGFYANYNNIVNEVAVTYVNEQGITVNGNQNRPIGKLTIKGLQSRINFKYQNYSAFMYYTYTSPYNTDKAEDVRIGDIAEHKLCGGFDILLLKKLNINLIFNYVGEKPTGKSTTVISNPYDKIDSYFILNGAVTYNVFKGITVQMAVNNILDKEYFDPGVRDADGDYYAAKLPQYSRNFVFKLLFDF